MSITEILGAPVSDPLEMDAPRYEACTPPPPSPTQSAPGSRRGRLTTIALIVATLLLGIVTGWYAAAKATSEPVATVDTVPTVGASEHISGVAEMFTALYLSGTTSAPNLDGFYAGPAQQGTGTWVNQVAALRVEPSGDGFWDVTVAADSLELANGVYESVGVQYFKLTVADQSPYPVVVAAPARIPAPKGPVVNAAHPFSDNVPSDQAAAITHFINGYLTGEPDTARYVTPTARLQLFADPPYRSVAVTSILADPLGSVLVSAMATTPHGATHSLQYVLDMSFEAGVWEVADLASMAGGQ